MSDVIVNGPVFDGRADIALTQACRESERSIAILGASRMRSFLQTVLRKQTPYYRLQVEASPDHPGWKVWDQKVIYGPWLNGTGSRNKTTRFKGYFHVRVTAQWMQARAVAMCEAVFRTYASRWQ